MDTLACEPVAKRSVMLRVTWPNIGQSLGTATGEIIIGADLDGEYRYSVVSLGVSVKPSRYQIPIVPGATRKNNHTTRLVYGLVRVWEGAWSICATCSDNGYGCSRFIDSCE